MKTKYEIKNLQYTKRDTRVLLKFLIPFRILKFCLIVAVGYVTVRLGTAAPD